jgi:hypothetical protein
MAPRVCTRNLRSGRPPQLTPDEQALALQSLPEDPWALNRVAERVAATTAKRLSVSSLQRLATNARLRGKRVRKALKRLRDPDTFAQAQRALEALQHQEDCGKSALDYSDESGFALAPTLPYAWQAPDSIIELPARQAGRINCSG